MDEPNPAPDGGPEAGQPFCQFQGKRSAGQVFANEPLETMERQEGWLIVLAICDSRLNFHVAGIEGDKQSR